MERAKQHTAHPLGALYSKQLFRTFPTAATNANVTYAAVAHQVQGRNSIPLLNIFAEISSTVTEGHPANMVLL